MSTTRAPLTQEATSRRRNVAGVAAMLIVLATAATLPVASKHAGDYPAVQPIFATLGAVLQLITAYLLYVQYRVTRDLFFAALSGTYVYVAMLVAAHMASFPGLFETDALFGASQQDTVWLWVLWHGGYPLFALVALLLRTRRAERQIAARPMAYGQTLLLLPPVAALLLITFVLTRTDSLLPLVDAVPNRTLGASPAAAVVLLINGAALLACLAITRLRDLLSLWLAVALLACLADSLLTISGTARFSIGWYTARVQSVAAASAVLGVLIWEISSLYRRLAESNRLLAERAIRDGLTHAFNRSYFADQFPREFRRARREGRPLSLVMVDVDHFKAFNDSQGHLAGDRCLMALVDAFQSVIRRPADFVARYGGEEFVVVLPNTDANGAMVVAEALRQAVIRQALPRGDRHGEQITISLGVATATPDAADCQAPDDLIDRADDALYRAKHEGRDRIRSHEQPTAQLAQRETLSAAP